ncbi:MAG: hypothetical protein IT174_06845 [Acidobacteria bacterium]|nr:hypothetical protein [Acidobacteriota bacterium]
MAFPRITRWSAWAASALALALFLFANAGAQPKSLPPPQNLQIADQPGCPIRLTPSAVSDFGNGFKRLQYTASNTGTKIVWGFVLAGLEEADKQPSMVLRAAIGPGTGRGFNGPIPRSAEADPYVVSVDFVIFRDGTFWGPDSTGEADYVKGIFEGERAAVADVKRILERNDDAALREALTRDPLLADSARIDTKTKRGRGFTKGFGVVMIGLRLDYLGRGDLQGISSRLSELEISLGLAVPSNDGRRQISRDYWFNEPIKIDGLFRGDKPVAVDERFLADSDWLKGLRVRIKNNAGKDISYISLDLEFPETIATGNVMLFPFSYGPHPIRKTTQDDSVKEQGPVPAGSHVEMVVDDVVFNRLKGFLESRQPLDSVTRVKIRISMIHFTDGTAWGTGSFLKPDPNDPRRWNPVNMPISAGEKARN